jgi:hypothetical protein
MARRTASPSCWSTGPSSESRSASLLASVFVSELLTIFYLILAAACALLWSGIAAMSWLLYFCVV